MADAQRFIPGDLTFYRRYVGSDASDDRLPLPSIFASRFLQGGGFSGGTRLVVWRDSRSPGERVTCGSAPSWGPLQANSILAFDEEENVEDPAATGAFPWAAQAVTVGGAELPIASAFGFGWLDLRQPGGVSPLASQAWVTALMSAEGRFSVGHRAYQVVARCNGEQLGEP